MLANLGPDGARTVEDTTPLIGIDEGSFHSWRIQPVRHRLTHHPLLQTAPGIATMLGCRRIATAFTGTSEPNRRARFTLVGP